MKDEDATPLDMVKALGDPIRLRIMAALGVPRTVKQVGDYLEEDASKLYYHVKELYRVGLVDLVETRVVGGVAEKYYRAVEKRIDDAVREEAAELAEKDPEQFAGMLADLVSSVVASVLTEFSWFRDHMEEFSGEELPLSVLEALVTLTPEEAKEIAGELDRLASMGGGEEKEGARRYCFASLLFPMRPREGESV
jgi:DNA-binding transcriptional ArsR family regulator